MDVAVQLVQSYLRLNGYLTAAEYPLVESRGTDSGRVRTDIDMLAVRFQARSDPQRSSHGRHITGPLASVPDPALRCPDSPADMIVAEVKQGRAFVNPATRDPRVLAAALSRFGCCGPEESHDVVEMLLRRGTARGARGHLVRMVLFAERGDYAPHGWHWVHLDRVVSFVDEYLHTNWGTFAGVDLKDPALSWLALLHKCGFTLVREQGS